MIQRRHPYKKDPDGIAVCTCGAGRAEDVHNMMTWKKSAGLGNWYGIDFRNKVVYRIRTRPGVKSCWWPEFAAVGGSESWKRLGIGVGVSLVRAKEMCERNRELQDYARIHREKSE